MGSLRVGARAAAGSRRTKTAGTHRTKAARPYRATAHALEPLLLLLGKNLLQLAVNLLLQLLQSLPLLRRQVQLLLQVWRQDHAGLWRRTTKSARRTEPAGAPGRAAEAE